MSYQLGNQIRTGLTVTTLLLTAGGCIHASRSASEPARPTIASVGGFLSSLTGKATALFETRTVSVALDRIDQHDLPLDKTYRRNGTGRGVTVYVFDGGVLPSHPELVGRVRKGYDAFPTDPMVCNAHGTAVAGAVAGTTLGVAPGAEVVDIKMVECSKLRGTIKAIVDGAEWVIADAKKHGRRAIANWSFIADTGSHIAALDSAITKLREAGIPVVVSAGNYDIDACRVSPGNADGAIVVGASAIARALTQERTLTVVDVRAPNTAYGACIDVYAPGDSVLLPSFDAELAPSAQLWSGTSMSAGYVSGAVALYFEASPRATPDQALRHLRSTGTQNVVYRSESPVSSLLYVGTRRNELKSVAEVRAELAAQER